MVTRLDLGKANEKFIQDEVESGNYDSDSDVICKALQQMQEEKKKGNELRKLIAFGDEQIAGGETTSYSPDLLKQISQQAMKNSKLGLPIKDEVKP